MYRKFVYIYIYMFSFPREMEVSVSMKNGHKCIFLTWKKNIRYLK